MENISAPRSHGNWSQEQRDARERINDWLRDTTALSGPSLLQARGPAGVGKTTILVDLANAYDDVLVLTYQNRMASMLRAMGVPRVSTCHSFLYGPPRAVKVSDDGRQHLIWQRRDTHERPKLILIDETCQIDSTLGRDLLCCGAHMATFGDSYQLPPIGGQRAYFDTLPIDIQLSQVHRQALDSPVLRLATRIREGGSLPSGVEFDIDDIAEADIVIVAFRRSRQNLNCQIRRKRYGIRISARTIPQPGELVIASRTHYPRIFNGTIWEVVASKDEGDTILLELFDEAEGYVRCRAPKDGFNDIEDAHRFPEDLTVLDYAYAITAHRAQGGEWKRVSVIDETRSWGFQNMAGDMPVDSYRRRWLYVAVSRAREDVSVVES